MTNAQKISFFYDPSPSYPIALFVLSINNQNFEKCQLVIWMIFYIFNEAVCALFFQLFFMDSNRHNLRLSSSETVEGNCFLLSPLALKNLLEWKMGDQKKLRLFSLYSYV